MLVRPLDPDDYSAVAAVFAEGIATGLATFETEVPAWDEWDAGHLADHRFVAELDGEVVGWIAVVPYSRRAVYRGVGEESVYVAERARGRDRSTSAWAGGTTVHSSTRPPSRTGRPSPSPAAAT